MCDVHAGGLGHCVVKSWQRLGVVDEEDGRELGAHQAFYRGAPLYVDERVVEDGMGPVGRV